jgi:hypothetical protein
MRDAWLAVSESFLAGVVKFSEKIHIVQPGIIVSGERNLA